MIESVQIKFTLCSVLVLFCCGQIFAQSAANPWFDKPETRMRIAEGRKLFPLRYRTAGLNVQVMRDVLFSAPQEENVFPSQSNHILEVPLPDGGLDSFRIVMYTMMESGLANRYPDIRTFRGVHVQDPFRTIRCDWTVKGFSAIVTSRDGRYHIEPYARGNQEDYLIFYKRDYPAPTKPFSCGTEAEMRDLDRGNEQRVSGDCTFRTYRLAVATTGEYSDYFGAESEDDEELVLSEVVIAVNRVNGVYEKDVTVRMILIENTTDVFYYNPATDPFSGDACTQLGQNQTNMTNVIGSANYDIGHVFGVGSGGCAGLSVVCSTNNKARGATGTNPPDGDLFYIDYVAHEIGHQFGGQHTQNNPCNSVSGSRMEPGSASTIMGYAGICTPNVQNNSDDYFHGLSIEQMSNFIVGGGNSCDVPITWENTPPILTAGADYSIPISTSFVLTAVASDPDNDPMTYCWEQWDPEVASMPPSSTNTAGPMFRSFDPDNSPSRYFPRLQDLVNNISPTWEVLPSVTRAMEFRVTVRDFHNGMAGCTDEDNINVSTTATAGPFIVTSPNTAAVSWTEGTEETVTWNVANTTNAPVNCPNVDILLSYDGGFTYPAMLATQVPNDGSHTIEVPAGTTSMARVMVKGANHIFFDISNQNFEILTGNPTYALSVTPSTQAVCPPGMIDYTINVQSLNGYVSPVTLSASGNPAGSVVSFSANPVIPGNTSQMTISIPPGTMPDHYTLEIDGASLAGPKNTETELVIVDEPVIPVLSEPADGATGVLLNSNLTWESNSETEYHAVELSADAMFADIVFEDTTSNFFILPGVLDSETVYYWRVRAVNACGTSNWSAIRDFRTVNCDLSYSTDVPLPIPSNGSPTIISELNVALSGAITDVNVIDLEGTHTWLSDLRFTLTSPLGTDVVLIDRQCGSTDNFNINLDDQAPAGSLPCPYNNGQTYRPLQPLSAFNGQMATGTWVLTVEDVANQDGGSLNSWALEICTDGGCIILVSNDADAGNGSLRDAIDCAAAGDTIMFVPGIFGSTIHLEAPLLISGDVHIRSTTDEDITLDGSAVTRAVHIEPFTEVSISGLSIIGGSALAGCGIQNEGDLLLKDVVVIPGTQATSLLVNLGTLVLEGQCQISD